MRLAIVFLFFFPTLLLSQTGTISGRITDLSSEDPLIGVNLFIADNIGTTTDIYGRFEIEVPFGTYSMVISYIGYDEINQEVTLSTSNPSASFSFKMESTSTVLETATITSGRYKKPLGEVTVSLEVLQPELIDNTSKQTLDQAIEKIPGVQVIDRQANIRGGSGFAAGAGSRVLLLIDDIPILQPDAGFPNWDDIPMENLDQVEVIKGAASALYGSSAMNGIINVRTAFAPAEPVTKASIFSTFFLPPRDRSNQWWDFAPYSLTATLSHRQKFDRFDLVVGGFYLTEENFERHADRHIGRFSFSTRFRVTDRFTFGVNGNINTGQRGSWFYWVDEERKYEGDPGTFVNNTQTRFNIDPYVTIFDKKGSRHKIQARYLGVDNDIFSDSILIDGVLTRNNQSNNSSTWYAEYQFQRKFQGIDLAVSAGLVFLGSRMTTALTSDTAASSFSSRNVAGYVQVDKKFFDRLNVSAGFRYEYNRLSNPDFINCATNELIMEDTEEESKPVFRVGLNYQLFEQTYLRASWGQGYRYPTLTEKFICTNVGGFNVIPNPELQSETGWSTELAFKQGFKVGSLDGFLDVAGFLFQYQDMIEFNVVNQGDADYQAINIGDTEIKGVEVSLFGKWKALSVPLSFLAGYMYIDPRFREFDSTPLGPGEDPTLGQTNYANSTSEEDILKYRNQHQLKFDIEATIGKLGLGVESFYVSKVTAIDVFLQFTIPGFSLDGTSKEAPIWRNSNNGYFLLNPRASFKFSDYLKATVVLNNALNQEYAVRPGRIQAPMNLIARLDLTL